MTLSPTMKTVMEPRTRSTAEPVFPEPTTTEPDLITFIEKAITDSFDPDWKPIHSARAVAYALIEGGVVSVRRSPEQVAELAKAQAGGCLS